MVMRRTLLKMGLGTALTASMVGLAGRAWAQDVTGSLPTEGGYDLTFDPTAFEELTTTVATAEGERKVTYHFYKAIPYVVNPVDIAYQSLNISVPVALDDVPLDASQAPILFANSVGGYMPSSVAEATGVGGGGMTGLPPGGIAPGGTLPGGTPPGDGAGAPVEVQSGGNAMLNQGRRVNIGEQALAAGYVVVEPGARGRTLVDASGVYYGVAPAAIVDLKAAVRYIRSNAGRIPGNVDWIVSSGTSAGGALSALLGASGDSPLYDEYLVQIGAADASDAIFATGAWCPIADLEHADMAYEWNWGQNPLANGDMVDQALSQGLRSDFADYQASLDVLGKDGFGQVTADNYGEYLLTTYLIPSASQYLAGLSEEDRNSYLSANSFITWEEGKARFSFADFLTHVGARKKGLPAFDAFDLSSGENNLFGFEKVQARHFTTYSLRHDSGDPAAELDEDLPEKINIMNPMYFISDENPDRARYWWLRVGTKDSDTSLTIVSNLALSLENRGDEVDTDYYWDAGHGANEDPDAFMAWIGKITGYRP